MPNLKKFDEYSKVNESITFANYDWMINVIRESGGMYVQLLPATSDQRDELETRDKKFLEVAIERWTGLRVRYDPTHKAAGYNFKFTEMDLTNMLKSRLG